MERLLADAEQLSGVHYDISNLSDVYEAIHVVQEELGVTGTTAKEAQDTLQGSFASMQASWKNFLSGAGDLNQFVKSFSTFAKNVLRIAKDAVPDIIAGITEAMPDLLEFGGVLIQEFATAILNNFPILIETAFQIVQTLITGLVSYLPQIIEVGLKAVVQLIQRNYTSIT